MKTKEKLNSNKEAVEALSEDELKQVTGGLVPRDVASRTAKERCDKLIADGKTVRITTNYKLNDDE